MPSWLRRAVVAGSFYPAGRQELLDELHGFAAQDAKTPPAPVAYRGAVCPHAGYVYSGALTWQTLSCCQLSETVVILSVNHRHPNPAPWAVWPEGAWQTPLGEVPVDAVLAQALMQAAPELTASQTSHAEDHSTEVLLPFLQVLRPDIKIVPICPFLKHDREALAVGAKIAAVLQAWPSPVLVIASNDMTHFKPAQTARAQDTKAIDRMLALDPAGLIEIVRREKITMCGCQPVATMLTVAKGLGATRAELVGYTNSGVVTGIDRDVVAYAGVVVE